MRVRLGFRNPEGETGLRLRIANVETFAKHGARSVREYYLPSRTAMPLSDNPDPQAAGAGSGGWDLGLMRKQKTLFPDIGKRVVAVRSAF
jgi:hypothetical protein